MEKTAYEILGVSETATDEEIKKQYHTLMRGVHSDATKLKDLTEEERQQCEKLVREYNEAYGKLNKGKRVDYDKELAQKRENFSFVYGSAPSSSYSSSESWAYQSKVQEKTEAQKVVEKIILDQFDELFRSILNNGFSFSGSITSDPKQSLKQEYWKLKSEKENLEKELKSAERSVEIEFMKKSSTNEIQLNLEFRNLSSKIVSYESERNRELNGAQQHYVFQASKRFVTQKKLDRLRQQLTEEENQINAKYNMLIEAYKQKQDANRKEVAKYQKELKEAIDSDSKVLSIKRKLSQIQSKLNSLEEKLGYKTQSTSYDYTSGYGEKSRVSV